MYSLNSSNLIAWIPLILDVLANMCIVIICCPAYDVINLEINRSFLIKSFSYKPKSQTKIVNILRSKRAFHMR